MGEIMKAMVEYVAVAAVVLGAFIAGAVFFYGSVVVPVVSKIVAALGHV